MFHLWSILIGSFHFAFGKCYNHRLTGDHQGKRVIFQTDNQILCHVSPRTQRDWHGYKQLPAGFHSAAAALPKHSERSLHPERIACAALILTPSRYFLYSTFVVTIWQHLSAFLMSGCIRGTPEQNWVSRPEEKCVALFFYRIHRPGDRFAV